MKDLKPGRELDALIAEKVMGIPVTKEQGDYWPPPDPGKNFSTQPIPDYSTDISAAWEVVEHMRTKHWRDAFTLFSPEIENATEWRAFFAKKFVSVDDSKFESGESAPHAICLAALKSVEK